MISQACSRYPSQAVARGLPPLAGGTPGQGYPPPRQDGGAPVQDRARQGYPPDREGFSPRHDKVYLP